MSAKGVHSAFTEMVLMTDGTSILIFLSSLTSLNNPNKCQSYNPHSTERETDDYSDYMICPESQCLKAVGHGASSQV